MFSPGPPGPHGSRSNDSISMQTPPGGVNRYNVQPFRRGADGRPDTLPFARHDPSGPGNKNTKHVPCKFFRNGTCTAGDACPYSHSTEPLEPCKFFLNGNCKYGKRCALPHLVDGHVVNPQSLVPRGSRSQTGGGASFPGPAQSPILPPGPFPNMPGQEHNNFPPQFPGQMSRPYDPLLERTSLDVPQSRFGPSPGLGSSPPAHGVSALDAPLPSSFNSQEAPNIAKYGPSGTSVPSRLGWDSLNAGTPSSTKAFGNLDSVTMSNARTSSLHKDLGSSPPTSVAAEVEPRKILHSQRRSRPSNISSSLPAQALLDDAYNASAIREDDPHEEDLLPSTLDDLLTPQERFRRLSRSGEEHGLSPRPSFSSFGSPPESKVGSPSHNSPSRFGSFFASQQAKRESQEAQIHNAGSALGHVGSPLRNSYMNGDETGTDGARRNQDFALSPSTGPISPPRSGHKNKVSSLSEQLKGVSIGSVPNTKDLEPHANVRNVSNTSSTSTGSAISSGTKYGDRTVSSSSVGRERIDEETLFSMDDEHEPRHVKQGEKVELGTPRRFADVVSSGGSTNGNTKGHGS